MKQNDIQPVWRFGWAAAGIAVTASLILFLDIAERQGAINAPEAQTTEQVANQAGATVSPSFSDRYD
jgi:hypothetical protein